ncbi:MAG: cyclic nucleotide-binding domain-containing protein [Curvibacter sp.]|nr:cyclic nucleotide-binding domain-containing protein [Curvibacter sp.]
MLDSLLNPFAHHRRRRRLVKDSPAAELAAQLLRAPTALMQLSDNDARDVISFMEPVRLPAEHCFMREGQREDNDYMLLLLEGEVTIESIIVSRQSPITAAIVGPGAVIGELGLIDGSPRSASCTTCSEVLAARLSRQALTELIAENPTLGVKLLMAISTRISARMRESNDKLKRYAALTKTMQQELDRLMPT